MAQLVLDPARDGDAEPLEELQGLERPADREAEDERYRGEVPRGALVVVVRDQVLRRVDVDA